MPRKNKEEAEKYRKEYVAKNRDKVRQQQLNWRAKNPDYMPKYLKEYHREYNLKIKYGLTVEDYNNMLLNQAGGCAICGKSPGERPFDVDHCHDTGKVRGLLCNNCNMGLGSFKDNIDNVRRAVQYLATFLESEAANVE